ncbi:uncharacterized protein NECHADRAFT_98184 [Fusarium vanettenii 77-13-4]|uniref:Uncharacterized protein n=1 Tax=Fusarium vanettenii (strain ATCC MYA-4622 / CBS 123669 / FGSC 9596 / NRRL 45880 / 77-13-4) TaxID=660122 RepID=C7ZND0_FUSV7|nr:uncharacterized protein NECHADRAFT_98184 [Fusarium vanettenii 77-13-4]EEU34479.1 hypothetical protein NECHADRAFT_98184 [Fusarium vanettenii 77-13-4]
MSLNASMRAVLWEGVPLEMNVASVPVPVIREPTDALVRITASALCGTDLHTYHGLFGSPNVPWIMGHEGMGYVERVGDAVSALTVGDLVVVPSQASIGHLAMGPALPEGFGLGTTYGDGGGCQSDTVDDIEYLFLSDIFPTGWAALDFANFEPGDTVAVFGAGPVGLLAAYSAILRGATKVYSVDYVQERLDLAASIGAIPINFRESDPVQQILAHEPDGVIRSLDCVGAEALNNQLERQQNIILNQMIEVTRARGGIGIVGEHSTVGNDTAGAPLGSTLEPIYEFPFSQLYMKSLSLRGGSVDPKLYAAQLAEIIQNGKARPSFIISALIDMEEVPQYYQLFDQRQEVKVVIRFP